ncbi:MAG: hypothetical protein ACXVX8_02730 [Blastococcus sp.]
MAGLDTGKATLTVYVRTPGPRGGWRAEMPSFSTMTWTGVAPGTRESAGKRGPVRPPHGHVWWVEANGSVGPMKG